MSDLDALLAAVLAEPECDTARLVYADALEETQVPASVARAEFIRVQIEWAQLDRKQDEFLMADISNFGYDRATVNRRRKELLNRSHQLFANSGPLWWNHLPGQWRATVGANIIETAEGVRYFIGRGFVRAVRGPLAVLRGNGSVCGRCSGRKKVHVEKLEWTERLDCPACHGTGRTGGILRELVRREPVERVVAIDLTIWLADTRDGLEEWVVGAGGSTQTPAESPMPGDLFKAIIDHDDWPFASREKAESVVSGILLAEAKQKAAVPA